MFSILKPRKDPALSSSYRPISLLDTIGKLFEKILLARILHLVNERGPMRDGQFGSRPTNTMCLQLTLLFERITRNFCKRCSPAQFSSTWPKPSIPLLQANAPQLPVLHSHTVSSYLRDRTIEASFQAAI